MARRTTMKALVTHGDGQCSLQSVPIPTMAPDEVLVKVNAAAQNPTDWKTLLLHKQPGNILGCDFAGTVVEIGANVPMGLRVLNERVAGMVHGGIAANGSYAEYLVIHAGLVISVPDHISFENAAQLGAACLTSCQALYQCLCLPTPLEPATEPTDVLIWSGTSATGVYAVQLAALAGLRVLSSASTRNIDFVKSLGAAEVYDYADSRAPKWIVEATGGELRVAMDCISEGMTPVQVSMALGRQGGTIATLLPYQSRRRDAPAKAVFVLVYSIFGKAVEFPFKFPASTEHHENAKEYCRMLTKVLATMPMKPIPVRLYPDGLASVQEGFEDMKAGKIHAEKVTYRIGDTPGIL